VTVELAKIFRRNPVLDVIWATDLVHLITIDKALLDAEATNATEEWWSGRTAWHARSETRIDWFALQG
jgi:hypothetical protein